MKKQILILKDLYVKFFNLHKKESKQTKSKNTKYVNLLNRICKLANRIGYEIIEKNFYFMVDCREKAKFQFKIKESHFN